MATPRAPPISYAKADTWFEFTCCAEERCQQQHHEQQGESIRNLGGFAERKFRGEWCSRLVELL